jgi:secondary thiamine-phosphate synthase enzyme
MRKQIEIRTKTDQEFVNLDQALRAIIKESGIKNGKVLIFCPHTTAGLTINENGDPDVVRDILTTLNKVYPVDNNYRHYEGNSHAHIKSSLMGVDLTLLLDNGKLLLGTWQSIYFCEFDGPRQRKIVVDIEGV